LSAHTQDKQIEVSDDG